MSPTQTPRILIVIPCYNEEASIVSVVNDVAQARQQSGLMLDTLVVNDCSTDGTLVQLQTLPGCNYLNLPVNLGIGGAMQAGYPWRSCASRVS